MSEKKLGNFIGYTPIPSGGSLGSASGVWYLDEQERYQETGNWPNYNPVANIAVQFCVVGGGGGGAGTTAAAGGGGGGGLREGTLATTTGTNITVSVGAGGARGNDIYGALGSQSVFDTVISSGGGGGGHSGYTVPNQSGSGLGFGLDGGSGGGGGQNTNGFNSSPPYSPSIPPAVTATGGTAFPYFSPAQGSGGGSGYNRYIAYGPSPTLFAVSGGGGGAGGGGTSGGSGNFGGANGGPGKTTTTDGNTYAGGGGGGWSPNWPFGTPGFTGPGGGFGGTGGGGPGVVPGSPSPNGTTNTGGGGGRNSPAGNGGSGIIVLKYWKTDTISFGAGVTGTKTISGDFEIATITAGTGTVSWASAGNPAPALTVDYLVISGGGGGAAGPGGGGGGGGQITGANGVSMTPGATYAVSIGAGGAGAPSGGFNAGSDGSASSFASFVTLQAGGKGNQSPWVRGGISGFAYSGGTGVSSPAYAGGGGGGNTGVGGAAIGYPSSYSSAGSGGPGTTSTITGVNTGYGGGGGGGGENTSPYPGYSAGGTHGGGSGNYTTTGGNGTVNSGGGGGGGGRQVSPSSVYYGGGNGGSGAIILRYPSTYNLNVSAGVSVTTSYFEVYKISIVTAGTGTISWSA